MFKPYPTYKDSSVSWLGDVPEHWGVLPNRALFEEIKEREHPHEKMLSVTITQGVIHQRTLLEHSSKKDNSKEDRSAYKLVCPCDIAYNKMRAWQGAIGASDFRGIVSPAYVVVRLREANHPRYFHYLLRTPQFTKEAERWSYGITSDMWSLRPEHFKMIYGCLPPLPEQAGIVRYLDYVDSRISRYIRAKQKLIKMLEEQKQSIIHRTVTRGLDPNVRLKPSGVEWLGDVPEHWVVKPLKHWTRLNARTLAEGTDPDFEFRYIDIGTVNEGRLVREPIRMRFRDAPSRARRVLHKGDTIVSTVRTYLKAVWYVEEEADDLIASTGFAVLSPGREVEPAYLGNVLKSKN
jgi:type I restriction enzyme S subunit